MPLTQVALNDTLVSDLSPLSGAPLVSASLANTRVIDLSPLAQAPLQYLNVSGTRVRDLSPFANSTTLQQLRMDSSDVRDTEALRAMPLKVLSLRGMKSHDYSFLRGLRITELELDMPEGGIRDILLTMPNLKKVNGVPWSRR